MEMRILVRNVQPQNSSEVVQYNNMKFKIESVVNCHHSLLIYILNDNGLHLIANKNDLSNFKLIDTFVSNEESISICLHNFKVAEDYIKMIFS